MSRRCAWKLLGSDDPQCDREAAEQGVYYELCHTHRWAAANRAIYLKSHPHDCSWCGAVATCVDSSGDPSCDGCRSEATAKLARMNRRVVA